MNLDKIKKIFKNKFVIISFILILIFILIISIINGFRNHDEKQIDAYRFKEEYEVLNDQVAVGVRKYPRVQIPEDNVIKYSNMEEVLNIFSTESDAVIYFGYSTCLYCRSVVNVLMDSVSRTELDIVYYVDIEDFWDVKKLNSNGKVVTEKEADSKYNELLNLLGDELVSDYILKDKNGSEVKTGSKRIEVPLVLFITNGDIISYNIGTLFSHEDPFVELDFFQKEGLRKIYDYGIKDVITSKQLKGLLK